MNALPGPSGSARRTRDEAPCLHPADRRDRGPVPGRGHGERLGSERRRPRLARWLAGTWLARRLRAPVSSAGTGLLGAGAVGALGLVLALGAGPLDLLTR